MIDAGLPLVQCLDLIASQQANRTFKAVLIDIKETVSSGSTFAQALQRHPKVFDTLFINLVAAGEVGGILDTILNLRGFSSMLMSGCRIFKLFTSNSDSAHRDLPGDKF